MIRAILRWAHAHRVAVLAAAALIAIASAASLRRLQFAANILHALPRDGVAVPAFRDYLERFGSLAGVKSATVSELASVEGVSIRLAERILEHLQGN